jgi:hypothetical protein
MINCLYLQVFNIFDCLGVVDTGGKWKKSSIIKVLIILFGHLWEVESTYRYIFAFKFTLKGQCHEIFCFRFFYESPSPKPLIITFGSFRIFSKIREDYSQVKVHHRCQ